MRHDFFVTVLLHLKFRRCLLREPIHGKRAAKGTKELRHRDYFDARIGIPLSAARPLEISDPYNHLHGNVPPEPLYGPTIGNSW